MVFDHGNKKVTSIQGLSYTDTAENRGERGGEEEETHEDRKGNGGINPLDNMFANKYLQEILTKKKHSKPTHSKYKHFDRQVGQIF